jgi:hypothetical protein
MPAIYQYRDFAAAGGVMSYGGNLEPYRLAGLYTGRILKGESRPRCRSSAARFTWPLGLRAQQEAERRVAVLVSQTPDDAEVQTRLTAFQQGLQQLGWTDGRNVGSMYASEGAISSASARTPRRWSDRWSKQHARCRSSSSRPPIQSGPTLSTVWRGQVATRPLSCVRLQHQREMAGAAQRGGDRMISRRDFIALVMLAIGLGAWST